MRRLSSSDYRDNIFSQCFSNYVNQKTNKQRTDLKSNFLRPKLNDMKYLLFTFFIVLTSTLCLAQYGQNDPTFNPSDIGFGNGDGFNDDVDAMAIQADDKVIVGGGFTKYNGAQRNHIARLKIDGTLDSSFQVGTGFDWSVTSVALQSDGKIVVGGYFSSYNGNPCNNLVRLNTDGTFDHTFNLGSGFTADYNGTPEPMVVHDVIIQGDDKIIASGDFDNYNGNTIYRIARLNPDGTIDNSFDPGPNTSGEFNTMGLQSDGKIVVAGSCQSCNGTASNNILRLNTDGSTDTSFNPGTGFWGTPHTLSIQDNDKIVIGGAFGSFDGTQTEKIVRLNQDGTIDNTFNLGIGFDYAPYSVVIQSNQQILIGGYFTSYNGTNSNGIIRLNSDGTVDNTFITGTGFQSRVYAMTIQSDGKIIAGGDFFIYNGTSRNNIARLNSDGSIDNSHNQGSGFNDRVYSIAIQDDGKIICGGTFTSFNGNTHNRIVRLNPDGSLDNSFDTGTGFEGYNRKVFSVAIQDDGKILVGGDFLDSYNGTAITPLVRLNSDGTLDASFDTGTGFTGLSPSINSIKIQDDGKILVGGDFSEFNGTSRNNIARIHPNGSLDNSFDPGTGPLNASIKAIDVQNDGKIILSGGFNSFNGANRKKIVRLNSDGSVDNYFYSGDGFDERVVSVAVQGDGKILAGGFFTTYAGTTQNGIIRLNPDGTIDNSFNTGIGISGNVHSIILQDNNKIILGGNIFSYNGYPGRGITRLNTDGTLDNSFDVDPAFDAGVDALAVQSDNKIIAGGRFTSYNDNGRNRIIRLTNGCVDISLNNQWSTITANNDDATYQWIDCSDNSIIPGETNQSFTATQDGEYAVVVSSTLNSCVDTSACINLVDASLEDSNLDDYLKLYPNPNNGNFTIKSSKPLTIEIYNSLGSEIFSERIIPGTNQLKVNNIESGIYILHSIDQEGLRVTRRVLIID